MDRLAQQYSSRGNVRVLSVMCSTTTVQDIHLVEETSHTNANGKQFTIDRTRTIPAEIQENISNTKVI